ncbi:hypothetical protein Tco_0249111 [Tanacetum coccineum]
MPPDTCSVQAPSGGVTRLESMRNRFFLGGNLHDKKITWVKWETCLASKAIGGLGIRSIFALNAALLFKWVWRFRTCPNSLWVQVIKSIHGVDGAIGPNRRGPFALVQLGMEDSA